VHIPSAAEIGSKVVGTARCAAAATTHAINTAAQNLRYGAGMLNAVDMLLAQHAEVFPLFDKVAATKDVSSPLSLMDQLCDALFCHMRIEEEIFYPAAQREAPQEQAFIAHSEDDHIEAKRMMATLLRMSPTSDEFDKQLCTLNLCIRQHKTEEEEILLPLARKVMSEELLGELADRMHERFNELMSQGKPRELVFNDISNINAMGGVRG